MRQYFAYIRVSTTRQGEFGVSLPQQRDAIERYSKRNGLDISRWFEEQETAAKQGRPVFGTMVRLLRKEGASGVIIHKIDRSARNLKDWADLGELIDRGIEVHFANEALDLTSRGGRLSADIQAVVASDYIRNLREETKKGIYGRLKQGYYPMPAPLGYVNRGTAKPKSPDPATAPLVRQAFSLYATGTFTLKTLARKLYPLGLRSSVGAPLAPNCISNILRNPFYFGLIRVKKTGEFFTGVHEPLISRQTFELVQLVLDGKLNTRVQRHDFLYRRRLACKLCRHSLVGETTKGFVYYRCHTPSCPTTCLREEAVDAEVLRQFACLKLTSDERVFLGAELKRMHSDGGQMRQEAIAGARLRSGQVEERLNRLTDAYIDRLIDRESFEARKKTLLSERLDLESQINDLETGRTADISEEVRKFLERADGACIAYKCGNIEERRDLLDALTSNCTVDQKLPTIMLKLPFSIVADRALFADGCPGLIDHRTAEAFMTRLCEVVKTQEQNSSS